MEDQSRVSDQEISSLLTSGLEDAFRPEPEHVRLQAFADKVTENTEGELAAVRRREAELVLQRRTAHSAAAEAKARFQAQPLA